MKKMIFVCLILAASQAVFSGPEDLEIYSYLYNQARTQNDQLNLLETIAGLKITGVGDFYAKALRRLLANYQNLKTATELESAREQAKLLSALLGGEKYTAAAPDLLLLLDRIDDPLVQAEALMAMGQMRAEKNLDHVILFLDALNDDKTGKDTLRRDQRAYGAIIALEKYGDPKGYLPVFFATISGYSKRVTDQAVQSLALLAENTDPTLSMIEVIKTGSNDRKYSALQAVEASGVSNDSKAKAAGEAQIKGWDVRTGSSVDIRILSQMRKLALGMLRRYGVSDDAIYPAVERSYKDGADEEEKSAAVAVLAAASTEKSVDLLVDFLKNLNTKRMDGLIRQEDERMVRRVIPALGGTKNVKARPALLAVSSSGWQATIVALAQEELNKLPMTGP